MQDSDKENRAREFLDKASKWLEWCEQNYQEMILAAKSGSIGNVEKHFVSILLLIDGIHQALLDASKKLGLANWHSELSRLRADDQLLRYMWNARRSEAHDAHIKWRPSMKHMEMRIELPETVRILQFGAPNQYLAAQRLMYAAFGAVNSDEFFEKIKSGFFPSEEQQLSAGIKIILSMDSLSLDGFKIGSNTISAPSEHLGKALPPSATEATRMTIDFYRSKWQELEKSRNEA